MKNESKCGGDCLFAAVASPKECAILHHEVGEALKDLKELRVEFTKLDKHAAVLAVRVTVISSVIGSTVALLVKVLVV